MRNRACLPILILILTAAPPALSGGSAAAQSNVESSSAGVDEVTRAMAEAASEFLGSLNGARRRLAQLEFTDSARVQWEYIPTYREGLPISGMTGEQRLRAHDLLRSALSGAGYLKVTSVMHLEEILRQFDTSGFSRSGEEYMVAIFGDPSAGGPWGWRWEGHHVSLNFTSVRPTELSATPLFLGTNPAEVRGGTWAGLRVLGEEEDVAFELLRSLSSEQRARAIVSSEAPSDILTRNDPVARELPLEGLPASAMTAAQRVLLLRLLELYAGNLDAGIAEPRLAAIREAGVGNLHFVWAGATERGEQFYWRLQGPVTLLEFDNFQNDGNHVHSVWRDLRHDFGGDVLRRHYETAAHHQHR